MKIAGISGSPRKNGSTESIIHHCLSFFDNKGYETDFISLRESQIGPCIHCDFCKEKPRCSKDEEANRVNNILSDADAIIVASPVYFGSMTGQLKCLFDKTRPLRRDGMKLKGKIGAAIATGGSRNGGQELTIQGIHAWMLVQGMIIVGDNSHFGGAVHSPFKEDATGLTTVDGTLEAVHSLLCRISG
ncbi:MAG TPA: flavodoxin family protein [Spirochaetota bacterium]|nr:flavodoxin family protein [Spirochaetota bacterium]HPQ54069.1 flavodoxin family protein [Spirochaetota bacterium]